MANRNFPAARQFGFHLMPVRLDAQIAIGASGAPTIAQALGIQSITRLAAGIYQLQLQDNYAKLLHFDAKFSMVVSGSSVAGGSFVTSTIYQIVSLGTTTQAQWVAAGLNSGLTAAVGMVFKAAGAGAGTGTVKALATSGISHVEILSSVPDSMLNNQPFNALNGGYITFACMAPTDSTTTTLIPTDPAATSEMYLEIMLNNSGVQ